MSLSTRIGPTCSRDLAPLTGQTEGMEDDWERLGSALNEAGVAGVEDLGRFVNNTKHFAP